MPSNILEFAARFGFSLFKVKFLLQRSEKVIGIFRVNESGRILCVRVYARAHISTGCSGMLPDLWKPFSQLRGAFAAALLPAPLHHF